MGLVAGVVLASPSSAQATELTDDAEGLLSDLERIVSAQQTTGWFVEKEALDAIGEAVMGSLCRAPPAARQLALDELERRHALTGDARSLYRAAGETMTSAVKDALFVERQLAALSSGIQRVDECPFWVRPSPDFQGLQTDRNRFILSLETGGNAQIRQTEGAWTLGGGGVGRLLAGYGFAGRSTLLAGIEFGGGAMLEPHTDPTQFVINYFPAIPIVFRIHDVSWHYDIEGAPVALFQADDGSFSFGVRGGFGAGVSALRTRGVIPWAGATLAYEHYFPSGGRSRAHFIRGGLRVGIVWDP